jgi:hypothetical protein
MQCNARNGNDEWIEETKRNETGPNRQINHIFKKIASITTTAAAAVLYLPVSC